MDCLETTSPFLPLPDSLANTSVAATATHLVVHVTCTSPTACCPLCQQPSDRIHGHYGRTVADLPCAGQRVMLALRVRKFVCRTSTCPQQIFTPAFSRSLCRCYPLLYSPAVLRWLCADVLERTQPPS
jgi:transposase